MILHLQSQKTYAWDSNTQGLLHGAFYYGYVISQVFGGWISHRIGAKFPIGISIFSIGILTLLSPLAADNGVWLFFIIRLVIGLGQVRFLIFEPIPGRSSHIQSGKTDVLVNLSRWFSHATFIHRTEYSCLHEEFRCVAISLSRSLSNLPWRHRRLKANTHVSEPDALDCRTLLRFSKEPEKKNCNNYFNNNKNLVG